MTNVTDHNEVLLLRISFFQDSGYNSGFQMPTFSCRSISLGQNLAWWLETTEKGAPDSKTTSHPCEIKMPPVLPPKKPIRKWSDQDPGAYEVPVVSLWTCTSSTSSTKDDPELRQGWAKRFQVRQCVCVCVGVGWGVNPVSLIVRAHSAVNEYLWIWVLLLSLVVIFMAVLMVGRLRGVATLQLAHLFFCK